MVDEHDNVVSLVDRRMAKCIADGSAGVFADPNSIEDDLLQRLGPGDGECAIGLMWPLVDPGGGDGYVGWYLTPATARELASLLRVYADDCERGYRDAP